MPMVTVVTNIKDSDVPEGFEVRLTDVLAKSMGKPRERVAVDIRAGSRIIQGASYDPVAVISIRSIGAVGPQDTIRHSQAVTELFGKELNLPANKVVIEYFDLNPNHVAIDGTTVACALAKK